MLVEDLNVNALVLPGEVFVEGQILKDGHVTESNGYTADGDWPIPAKLDVQFLNPQIFADLNRPSSILIEQACI